MSDRFLLATFEHEDDLLAATEAVGARLRIVDAFTPYAVHGLDRAMGSEAVPADVGLFHLRHDRRVGHAVVSALDGVDRLAARCRGKPWNSLPSDVPVAFEAAVLLAGFGSVFALFFVSRLFPGKQPVIDPRVTDDRFVLVIEEADATFDRTRSSKCFRSSMWSPRKNK